MRNTKYLLLLLFITNFAWAEITAEQIKAQMGQSADFFSYEEPVQDSVSTGNAGILKREVPPSEKTLESTESFQDLEKEYFNDSLKSKSSKKIRSRE